MFISRLIVIYLGLCLASVSVSILGQLPEDDELTACASYSGCFRGTYMEGFQSQQFQAFLGIPYAIPPLGDLRFDSPRRAGKNPDTVDASKPKPDCIHKDYLSATPTISGDEDCLYLNIYRPMPLSHLPLPVMVYIHGGGFIGGSAGPSVSGPEYFMDSQAVILVTVAYRLGVLGYLSTGDENMPGNYALKDQLLALKWVRDNIHAYGGDKGKVTLFGHGIDGKKPLFGLVFSTMFYSPFIIVYLCLCLASISVSYDDILTVCAPHGGCYRGTYMKGYQGEQFQAFMGIPYAVPPLGDLRFEKPRRMGKLFGTSDASKPKPDCINKNYLLSTPKVYGEEDCLYLNVYRPMPLSESPLPVMVYIHGGGFIGGSAGPSVSGPEYFMDSQAVILVTVSYRVGVFGFLSTGDGNMPGNFGLKDQTMALKWVQDNIYYYGGDQQKVTLFGHGIDGIATHLHLLSRASVGLFHRVISMSGTAIAPTAINRNPLEQARNVAEFCRIPNANNMSEAELTDALKYVDADVLVNAGDGFKYWDADPLHIYRPVIESSNQDAFLTADPELLMEQGNYIKVPWLLGSVPSDGAVRVVKIYENFELRYQFNLEFHDLLKKLTEFSSKYVNPNQKIAILREEYLNDTRKLDSQTVDGFLNVS
ncbi:juvenile hormone esterase-like [Drosophila tropicalis]|uniref:juvenile hormone esterase-like n=1 Tax=Drosophila tropicalis TaxID=46794 RepID=UPI0035AB973D